jgi:hypothetical protein
MELARHLALTAGSTLLDMVPIVVVLFAFMLLVLRRRPANLARLGAGFASVLLGLTLFLVGLQEALFPIGRLMAEQLTAPGFIQGTGWGDYYWVYLFAAAIGFATTIAEPALIAVALKASAASGGTINVWGLRLAVAVGVAFGVSLGAFRIVSGLPLHYFLAAGYAVVILQTWRTDRAVVPLAYDSGGVTTSTVTVPLVTALGLGLAANIPGRSPILDGFGLIAFASLFPMITVMGYAQLGEWRRRRGRAARTPATES